MKAFAPRHSLWLLFSLICCCALATRTSAQDEKRRSPSDTAAARQYAAAAALQNREVYDLAAAEWQKFLERFTNDSRANHARHYHAICLLKLDQAEEAAAAFGRLIEEAPKFPLIESSYLHLGIAQYRIARSGQADFYDRAARTLAELIRDFPRSKHVERALFYRGESLYARGKKADAAKHYTKLLADFPDSDLAAEALYALGVTQQELDQSDEARQTFARYLKRFPDAALVTEVALRLGETLFAAGEFDQAAQYFAKVADTEGFALADHALLRHAACLFEQGDYEHAAARYAQLPRRFPKSSHVAAARLSAGKSAYLAGKLPQARQHLEPLLRQRSDETIEAAHWIARSWLKEKQPANALAAAEAALTNGGTRPFALELQMDRADALYEIRDRRQEALSAYARIAAEHPKAEVAPQALYMASFTALAQGEHELAQRHAAAFLERYADSPLVPDVGYVAAEASLESGQLDDAEARYHELIANFADRPEMTGWKLRLAAVLQLLHKDREVIALLEPLAAKLSETQAQAEAYYLLGSSESRLEDHKSAARYFEASLKAAPDSSRAEETLLALADTLRQLNRADAAKARLEKLLAEHPGGRMAVHARYRLAEMDADAADYDEAARRYRAIVDNSPDSSLVPQALAGLGWAELNRGRHSEAVVVLNELIRKYPDEPGAPRARYARAAANYQLKQYATAIEDLKPLLGSDLPVDELSDARYVLGLCQSEMDEHEAAAKTFGDLLEQDEDYEKADHAYYELAWALKSLGREREAARAFGHLAEKHIDSPLAAEALYHLGEYYYTEEQFDRAASSYYASMRKAGKSELGEKAAHKLGWSYFRQDIYDKALGTLRYQRTTWPDGELAADAAFVEAECLFKQSKYDEALSAYADVRSPSSDALAALALLHAGQSAAQLKQWQQSADLLRNFLERFADRPYASEALYELAWDLQNLGQLDEALEHYEKVTESSEGELAARAQFMIGEIHFQQKKHDLAVRDFFKVAFGYAYPKWQAAAHYEAGRCFEVLGKLQQARKSYQEIVDNFPESEQAAQAQERLRELAQ